MAHDERSTVTSTVNAVEPRRAGRGPVHHVIRHPSAPLVLFTAAAAVVVAGTFAPWLRSGSTSRSSYNLLGLMDRLDIAPKGFVSTLVRWWPLVPLLTTSAVVSAWWRWTSVAVGAAVVSVVYAGGVGTAVVMKSRDTGITIGAGPWICAIGGLALLMSAAWLGISATRRDAGTLAAALRADRS